jgi:hypothetical protein
VGAYFPWIVVTALGLIVVLLFMACVLLDRIDRRLRAAVIDLGTTLEALDASIDTLQRLA